MIKNFIDIKDFNKKQLDKIIDIAKKIKKNPSKFSSICNNKTLGMVFEKQSLRTRVSFNVGMQKLGGYALELKSNEIGFDNKREDPEDILKVLSQYVDCIMIRNNNHDKILNLAKKNIIPIINGLTNYSHPCQILGDFLTIQESFKNYKKLKVTWIGDFNNVLTSLIHLQTIYLFKLDVVLPSKILSNNKKIIKLYANKHLKFLSDIKIGSKNSQCIMTDVWVSMGEKKSNKSKMFENFTVTKNILNLASKDVIFMHCLPAHRGQEVSSDVLYCKNSVVLQQAKNRMFIQQAILKYVLEV